jgi:type I restriction-modification system DNA methylase subunit
LEYLQSYGDEKNELKERFLKLQKDIYIQQIKLGGATNLNSRAYKISTWNPFSHNKADWFDAEWMFGLKDRFDIVIGNPPYVDVKALNDKDVTIYFKLYKTTSNRINLYSIFIEQGYNILNTNGILCFINPNSILVNSSYKKLRELILSDVVSIVKLPDHTFESATVETIVFLLQKNKTTRFVKGKYYLSNEHANLRTIIYSIYDKNIWKCDSDVRFNIFTNSETVSLLNKIELNALNLVDLADFSLGITPYDKAKGHSQSLIKSRGFHSDRKISDEYVPLIKGSNIEKYVVAGYSDEFLKYSSELGAPRQQRFFTDEKIIVRQIVTTHVPLIDN